MRENGHQLSAFRCKLLLFLLVLFITYSGANAQRISPSSTNLDIKNGFNNFELGKRVDEARKISKIQVVGKNTYLVTNTKNFPLFGYQPKSILLSYTDGLLKQTTITLSKPSLLKEQFSILDNILNKYESLYGKWSDLKPHDSILVQKSISGEKVGLIFTLYKEKEEKWATFVLKQL